MVTKHRKVSVLIPVYNNGQYLQEAVQSVEQQTYSDWEIVIVDDCSTDNSLKIADELKKKLNSRLRLIRNLSNQGVSRSRNIAFEAAEGSYIAFLDADDRWHPEKLEMQMKLFKTTNTPIHMVHTGVETFADLDVIEWLKTNEGGVKSLEHWNSAYNILLPRQLREYRGSYLDVFRRGSPICSSSVMIKYETLSFLGGFDEDLFYQVEDWLLWFKCSLFFQIRFIPHRLTYYRIHRQCYTSRVFIKPDYNHSVALGQIHDRCVAFARRKGLRLSYERIRPKVSSQFLPWRVVSKGARLLIRLLRRLRRYLQKATLEKKINVVEINEASMHQKDSKFCPVPLNQLIIFVTGACNLSCDSCFYKENLNLKDDVSFERIKSIADSLGNIEFVLLTGGEPFLRNDLERIIRLFIGRCNVGINTNGFFPSRIERILKPILCEKLSHGLSVSVSIDGFQDTHNKMRNNSQSFLKALDTLRVLNALREKYKQLTIIINTLISPINLNELVEFAREFAIGFNLNYHNFEIERVNPCTIENLRLRQAKLNQVYKELLRVIRRYYFNAYAVDFFRFKIQYANIIYRDPWPFPCLAGRNSVVVYSNGMLSACELRPEKINLADFDYNLSAALTSESMNREINSISKDRCFCTHGCWLLVSMYDYLSRKYGTQNYRFILRYQRMLDLFKALTK